MLEGPVGVILPYRPFAIGVLLVVVVGLGLPAYSAVVRPRWPGFASPPASSLAALRGRHSGFRHRLGVARVGSLNPTLRQSPRQAGTSLLSLPWPVVGTSLGNCGVTESSSICCSSPRLLMFPVNKLAGIGEGANHAELLDHVTADAKSGMAAEKLAEKYWRKIYPVDPSVLSARFEMLRDARSNWPLPFTTTLRIGQFRLSRPCGRRLRCVWGTTSSVSISTAASLSPPTVSSHQVAIATASHNRSARARILP